MIFGRNLHYHISEHYRFLDTVYEAFVNRDGFDGAMSLYWHVKDETLHSIPNVNRVVRWSSIFPGWDDT